MPRKRPETPEEDVEVVDESDSIEDSDDEDYELGLDIFAKSSAKTARKKGVVKRPLQPKARKEAKAPPPASRKRKLARESDPKEAPSRPSTSRLFEIVITRKHARLPSCLQRIYLALGSQDRYATMADILSFICECAGCGPGLVQASHLSEPKDKAGGRRKGKGAGFSHHEFGWNSFSQCYDALPAAVSYEDVLDQPEPEEPDDALLYGYDVGLDRGNSVSHKFHAMCDERMKTLTKSLDAKDGWMLDFGSVGFVRFCEFFNELVMQVEMQYVRDLLPLLQWVFALSTSACRPIRLLSTIASNELVSALLLKRAALRKDQAVLRKQLRVEAELDKRAAVRLCKAAVNLSNSTLDLFKRLSLVNVTCSVIARLVKSAFHTNYAAKAFDVFPDIRVLCAYYLVVHYLIDPALYAHALYAELAAKMLASQEDSLELALKFLAVRGDAPSDEVIQSLVATYPHGDDAVDRLSELLFLKYLNPDNGAAADEEVLESLRALLREDDLLFTGLATRNNPYLTTIFLLEHFEDHTFELRLSLDLANVKPRYRYAINPNNKAYHNHVYSYSRAGAAESEAAHLDKLRRLCRAILKYRDRDAFPKFADAMVGALIATGFLRPDLSYLRYNNYIKFTEDVDTHALFNRMLLALARQPGETDERRQNAQEFFDACRDVYSLNRGNEATLRVLLQILRELAALGTPNALTVAEVVTANIGHLLASPRLAPAAVALLAQVLPDGPGDAGAEKCKAAINKTLNAAAARLIKWLRARPGSADEASAALRTLNHFLTSFNFVALSDKDVKALYGFADAAERPRELRDELVVLFYLLYLHVVFGILDRPGYEFEGLAQLQQKLLQLLLSSRTYGQDGTPQTARLFVAVSSALNVLKLSNAGFLKKDFKFSLGAQTLATLQNRVTLLALAAYEPPAKRDPKEAQPRRRDRPLSLMNDGAVHVNHRYSAQPSDPDAAADADELSADAELRFGAGGYLAELTPAHMLESVLYQHTKTLNLELFASNVSVVVVLNACSGHERIRRAALKFLEVVRGFNLDVFNLIAVHTMFTLYELSQAGLLERLVGAFNQFENPQFLRVLHQMVAYVNRNQSNDKFQHYLTLAVTGNVTASLLPGDSDDKGDGGAADPTAVALRREAKRYPEIVRLIRYIKLHVRTGAHGHDIGRKIAAILQSHSHDDLVFGDHLLALRRTLDVESLERLCDCVARTAKAAKAPRTKAVRPPPRPAIGPGRAERAGLVAHTTLADFGGALRDGSTTENPAEFSADEGGTTRDPGDPGISPPASHFALDLSPSP